MGLSSTHNTSKSGNLQPRSIVVLKRWKIANNSVIRTVLATGKTTLIIVFAGSQGTKIQKVGNKCFHVWIQTSQC